MIDENISMRFAVLAFLTPIMWKPEMLGDHRYIADLNPLTHYVALIREPLRNFPSALNLIFSILFSLLLISIANILFNKFKKRLVFWL